MKFEEYKEYLQDNPRGLWFKAHWYGWGWVPVKWQGWATVLGFIAVLLLSGTYLEAKSPSGDLSVVDLIFFFAILVIAVIVLLGICYKKGEQPHWSWGDPRKK